MGNCITIESHRAQPQEAYAVSRFPPAASRQQARIAYLDGKQCHCVFEERGARVSSPALSLSVPYEILPVSYGAVSRCVLSALQPRWQQPAGVMTLDENYNAALNNVTITCHLVWP